MLATAKRSHSGAHGQVATIVDQELAPAPVADDAEGAILTLTLVPVNDAQGSLLAKLFRCVKREGVVSRSGASGREHDGRSPR